MLLVIINNTITMCITSFFALDTSAVYVYVTKKHIISNQNFCEYNYIFWTNIQGHY